MNDDEPFTLANDAVRPARDLVETEKQTQRLLLSGLDCLPGQLDLFGDLDKAE